MGLFFMGLFVRYLSDPRPWIRWVSDSAYWTYILHLPVGVFFQVGMAEWAWPGPLKYAAIMAATLGICGLTYQYGVRYTFIGTALNGRRTRTSRGATGSVS